MKLSTKTATIRHSCTQDEIRAHLEAIERQVLDRSSDKVRVVWLNTLKVDIVIWLATASVTGVIDASKPGEVTILVEGPSLVMTLFHSVAVGQLEETVRRQLGDKLVEAMVSR